MLSLIGSLLKHPWVRTAIALGLISGAMLAAKAWYDTMRDPVIQRLSVESKHLPAGSPPVTIALVADIHMAGPDMTPARVERIVEQTNALGADLIVIAGDLVSEKMIATKHYSAEEIVAPLARLTAPLGVVFVPGNHDHWFGWEALASELDRQTDIIVLQNEAVQLGPIALAGLDDEFTDNHDIEATRDAMLPLTGAQVWLSHTPDVFPSIPVSADLALVGHTHCAQLGYPWGGSPVSMSKYGEKYMCGVVRENEKTMVISAGLGTSALPMRLFTQPELWLIEVKGMAQ